MEQLLANPAIQSAVIPFVTALAAALILRRFGWVWAGLGLALAFYLSVYITVGLEFTPLTSTHKIILLGLLAMVVGLLVDARRSESRNATYILAALTAAAVLWVIWPVASRKAGTEFWMLIVPSMLYSAIVVVLFERLKPDSMKSTAALLAIGVGTGVCALLGASAKLGQLGGAIGAAAGAYILILLFSRQLRLGSSFTFTGALLVSLIGVAGVVYAKLPWYILLILLSIPAILTLPIRLRLAHIPSPIVYTCAVLIPAGIAIYITLQIAGAPPV